MERTSPGNNPVPPPGQTPPKPTQLTLPDFDNIRQQLRQHRDLSLELLWQEYRQHHPDGYCYSRFCKLYRRWRKRQDLVLRQDHRPGEKLFLAWAGATLPIRHRDGSVSQAPLFVSALGVSSYTYAEVLSDKQMPKWLEVQRNALEFYQGCPQLLILDNTETGVTRACLYKPDLNPTYQDFALPYQSVVKVGIRPKGRFEPLLGGYQRVNWPLRMRCGASVGIAVLPLSPISEIGTLTTGCYGVAIMPTRPRKPRDKAEVESAVLVVP